MEVDKKEVKWTVDSPLSLSLKGNLDFEESNGIIKSVTLVDSALTLPLGHTQMYRKMPYKINFIEKVSSSSCLLKIANRTKASLFIMPMLGGSKDLYFLILDAELATTLPLSNKFLKQYWFSLANNSGSISSI